MRWAVDLIKIEAQEGILGVQRAFDGLGEIPNSAKTQTFDPSSKFGGGTTEKVTHE